MGSGALVEGGRGVAGWWGARRRFPGTGGRERVRSSKAGVVAIGLVAVASGLLGLAVIENPGVALPFSIEFIALFGVTVLVLTRERDLEVRQWLTNLLLAALGLRLILALFVHFQLSPYFFAPDAIGYERMGKQIGDYWAGSGLVPQALREGWRPSYIHLNAVFHYLFGESSIALVVLNMFAGVWTALLTFYLTREFLSVSSAKVAALLTAFFPSLVLWSILNIRDALATLAIVLLVLYGVRLSKGFRASHVVIFAASLLGLGLLRDYMAFLVVSGLAIGSVTALRPDRLVGTMAFGTVVGLAFTYFADQVGLFSTMRPEEALETAQILRLGLQAGATSAFGIGAETETVGGALRYLPLGVSYLLFSPFPWAIQSSLQLTAMPETLLWYPLFLLALKGVRISLRGRLTNVIIVLAVLVIVVSSYALVEGNFGTAYRHRAQIMPLFFVFSGVGLSWLKERVITRSTWWRTRTTKVRLSAMRR